MEDVYVIDRPNRAKAASLVTRAVVVALLLASAALLLVVIVGGWSALQGGPALQLVLAAIYVGMAVRVARWSRGVLPVAAACAILLLIFAAIAGPQWFERSKDGFAVPELPAGGTGLDPDVLGVLTLIQVPLQLLVLFFAMQGFRQEWHVEVEVPRSQARWPGARPPRPRRRPGARRPDAPGAAFP